MSRPKMAQWRALSWPALGAAALLAATPATAALRGDILGELEYHIATADDFFVDLARRYDVGYVELVAANPGVDPWLPGRGAPLIIPTAHLLPEAPRRGIVINLAEMRLYYFDGKGGPVSHPLGIGQESWETPLGSTTVSRKGSNPTWYPPKSIRAEKPWLPAAVPPGPDNPLGEYAVYLGWPKYLIHGTNKPAGVGRRVSHGCLRMYPEDIEALFSQVAIGTPVTVVDQPLKVGWRGRHLYIEVHPTQSQADQLEIESRFSAAPVPDLRKRIMAAAGDAVERIDWRVVETAAAERLGIPVRITRSAAPMTQVSSQGR